MANWYVRPNGTHSATRDGLSYATAWGGWDSIVWASLAAGDTLYVCGTYNRTYAMTMTAHGGTSSSPVTIRGDYAGDPGVFNFNTWGTLQVNQSWTTIESVTITQTVNVLHAIDCQVDGIRIKNSVISGGAHCIILSSTVVATLFEVTGCYISGPETACIGYAPSAGSIIASGITISNNVIHDSNFYGVYVHVTGAGGTTSRINNVKIRNNEVYNTVRSTISFAGTNLATPDIPTIYSTGLEITGNYVHDAGRTAGDTGTHGGLHVTGAASPLIYGNTVRNVYAWGAGIQTLRNYQPKICFNIISGVRSGAPTSLYQNGLPIDGNGIFFDNGTIGGLAWGNHISDLITTGNIGSGCGIAIWDCVGVTYYGNIIENVACGAFYGYSTESGNGIYNNTFINCTTGIQKVSESIPAGNTTIRNNILINCETGFASTTAEAKMDNSYNCIYGSTTTYSNVTPGSHDITTVDPDLDADYRPRALELIRSASYLTPSFRDYYNKHFFGPPSFGAVEDLTDTQRYILKKS